jgi:1-phosphatidylinositol-3-phosphate 5-kinase
MSQNKRFERGSFFNQLFGRKNHRRSNSPTPSEASLASFESEQPEIPFTPTPRPDSHDGSEISGFRELIGLEHKNRLSRDYWMRDEKVKECYDCKQQFTAFRRRHHCRICGQIFCHRCASSIVSGEQFGYQGEIRACNYCIKVVDDYYKNPASHKVNIPSQSLDRNRSSLQLGKQPSLAGSFTENKDGFRKIIKSPTFYEKVSDVPFRNRSISDDQMDNDQDIFEEEYAGFQSLSNPVPKSFVKERIPSPMDDVYEDQKRASLNRPNSLIPRRKFSTRGINSRYITQIQYISTAELEFEEKTLSHFRSVSESLNVDINAASVNHVRKLMRQMLQNAEINRIEEWEEIIVKMLLNVCHRISPDVRNGDEIDVRNYVKIKKIQGGKISDSHYVNGVVASKNVLHKKMLKPVENPKILLLTFALEYQRVQNQYMSLEPLIAQERDHLKNLVGRVLALKPDIVMVEKTVARLALEFFVEAGIIVIQNVKANVLSAVARCSKADIIHSIDKLSLKNMGTCEKFSFKTFLNKEIPGIRKTFMLMEGCPEALGCTMVLRGGSTAMLDKVKEIVDFLVFVVYSLKLETCLFQDQYVKTPSIDTTVDDTWSQLEGVTALDTAICKFKTQILSSSPNVIFPLPYVLQRMHEQEKSFPLLICDLKPLSSKEEVGPETNDVNDSGSIKETVQNPTTKVPDLDLLTPYTQQSIMVMYSNISVNAMVHCIPLLPHLIEYYRDTDLTLGQFIEDTCFGSKFKCPVKTCEQ